MSAIPKFPVIFDEFQTNLDITKCEPAKRSIEVNAPPISDQATSDFSSLMSLKDKGTKST